MLKRSERPVDGAFSSPAPVSDAGEFAIYPDVSVGDAGAAIVAGAGRRQGSRQPRVAARSTGGSFAAPVDVPGARAAGATTVELNAKGDAVLCGSPTTISGSGRRCRCALRAAGSRTRP